MGEFTEQLDSLEIVSVSGLLAGREQAKVRAGSKFGHFCPPLVGGLMQRYTLEFRCVVGKQPFIGAVLPPITWTKVASAIIKGIVITVVNAARFRSENFVRHPDTLIVKIADGIKTFCEFIKRCIPAVFVYAGVFTGVHYTCLPFCQSYIPTRYVIDEERIGAHYSSVFVKTTSSTKGCTLRFYATAFWALAVSARMNSWLGASFPRRHDLTSNEIMWLGHTRPLYQFRGV